MCSQFARTELLIGSDGMEKLKNARIAVFGIGGVGGYAVEALARSGIGTLDLIDNDKVCLSNLNRQIIASHSTIGKYKVDVARERILDINPEAAVNIYKTFYMPDTAELFDFSQYDYVVDAIDTVTGKIQLVLQADAAHTPIISSMGAGNKMNPAAFQVADIYETSVCPLAKVMRHELKKRGIRKLKVVYSTEAPIMPCSKEESGVPGKEDAAGKNDTAVRKKATPGSNAFVPSVAGLIMAGEVIKDLLAKQEGVK
ncbi:MAG: tRNA threonylcarbamoyladenosine dehydratase [Lachnospiraceae bacterium]|nr:tRNA threonylcarbamoyladenosine dehydratase [Lachnospiraceae bacterium]